MPPLHQPHLDRTSPGALLLVEFPAQPLAAVRRTGRRRLAQLEALTAHEEYARTECAALRPVPGLQEALRAALQDAPRPETGRVGARVVCREECGPEAALEALGVRGLGGAEYPKLCLGFVETQSR